jgi:cytochrome c peroxidase
MILQLALFAFLTGCSQPAEPVKPAEPPPVAQPSAAAELIKTASGVWPALKSESPNDKNPISNEKVELGRMLYFDTRLSKSQELSCNSCHMLDTFGVDNKPTSTGHRGQLGGRNSPSVYNAAFHTVQFWDGRAADVEEQAKGPVLNPVEMAMPSEEAVVNVIKSIPGYADLFAKAFPGEADPITYDNIAKAIGAFERKLVTPARYDQFVSGDEKAITEAEQKGLKTFMEVGCGSCHMGATFGGTMYQKLGVVKPWDTKDMGRFEVTKNEADKLMFKVPSLRNVEKTSPYLHDGSIVNLPEMISLMGTHQLGRELTPEQVNDIEAFLKTLTGKPADEAYIAKPTLPESGPNTPKPDPT